MKGPCGPGGGRRRYDAASPEPMYRVEDADGLAARRISTQRAHYRPRWPATRVERVITVHTSANPSPGSCPPFNHAVGGVERRAVQDVAPRWPRSGRARRRASPRPGSPRRRRSSARGRGAGRSPRGARSSGHRGELGEDSLAGGERRARSRARARGRRGRARWSIAASEVAVPATAMRGATPRADGLRHLGLDDRRRLALRARRAPPGGGGSSAQVALGLAHRARAGSRRGSPARRPGRPTTNSVLPPPMSITSVSASPPARRGGGAEEGEPRLLVARDRCARRSRSARAAPARNSSPFSASRTALVATATTRSAPSSSIAPR